MAKFLKVTDSSDTKKDPQIGYHDVNDDFELPLSTKYDKYEFVEEDEARAGNPALFGIVGEVAKPIKGLKGSK